MGVEGLIQIRKKGLGGLHSSIHSFDCYLLGIKYTHISRTVPDAGNK